MRNGDRTPDRQAMADRLASRIELHSHGRVSQVCVEWSESEVVLRGRARTQYAKQLALNGVLELLGDQHVVNAIEVI
jgi:osmotically-inducible protein OsmY